MSSMFSVCRSLSELVVSERFVIGEGTLVNAMYDDCGVTGPTHTVSHSTLSKGSSGEAVKTLQRQLIRLGYLSGTADGYFGDTTESALNAYWDDNKKIRIKGVPAEAYHWLQLELIRAK